MAKKELLGISMFCGGGVADLGFKSNNIKFISHNEIIHQRAELAKINNTNSKIFAEDAWTCYEKIIEHARKEANEKEIFLLFATPPCQGMSPNGAGSLLSNIRKGNRSELDPRNRLIIPALKVAQALKPEWIVFENVPNMENTIIQDEEGNMVNIIELIKKRLDGEYVGKPYLVEFANYGLPQRRKRLITVFTRNKNAIKAFNEGISLIPKETHSRDGTNGLKKWISVTDALKEFEQLDSKDKISATSKKDALHRVPVLDEKKYFWIANTLENSSAFDNQCVNPKCKFQDNPSHGMRKNENGINQSKKDTPLYCIKCSSLLPRPYTEKDGKLRIMSGYTSAYKRMSPTLPAPTLTTNFLYPCSDHKIHPKENRVLSFSEASKLQSISDYSYKWGPLTINGMIKDMAPSTLMRDVIGESAPPMFFDKLAKRILNF